MGKFLIIGMVLCTAIGVLLYYLVAQSKKPSGWIGRQMMKMWNKVYLPMATWALQRLPQIRPENILDVGVGNGQSSKILAVTYPSATVSGIDIAQAAIEEAKKLQNQSLTFLQADVENLPFTKDSFGLVTAFQTHFHWPCFEKAIAEIGRVTKSGGYVLLACETAKIKIYAKEYATDVQMQKVVHPYGFTLKEHRDNGQWSAYILEKSN